MHTVYTIINLHTCTAPTYALRDTLCIGVHVCMCACTVCKLIIVVCTFRVQTVPCLHVHACEPPFDGHTTTAMRFLAPTTEAQVLSPGRLEGSLKFLIPEVLNARYQL